MIRSYLSRAQATRAVLLAMATSTTFVGGRAKSRSVQPGPVPGLARRQRSTVRAPCTSKRLIVPSPRFDIRPSLSLPPLECCRGTRPSQAESCRPERNCAPSPIVATSAVAVMTPTPGIVARRRLASLERCHAKSVASSSLTYDRTKDDEELRKVERQLDALPAKKRKREKAG